MPATASMPQRITTTTIDSPVGPLTAGATDEGICLLEFAGPRSASQVKALASQYGRVQSGEHHFLDQLRAELAEYFAGQRREFDVPIICRGTPFQEAVWGELLRIPFGQTRSYIDVARAIGSPNACRAVGRTNGQNRVAILIPCHRVVNAGGSLGGYGGGLDRKQLLLDLERRAAAVT